MGKQSTHEKAIREELARVRNECAVLEMAHRTSKERLASALERRGLLLRLLGEEESQALLPLADTEED